MRMPNRPSLYHPTAAAFLLLLLLAACARAQQGAPDYAELPRFHQVSERLFRGGQPAPGGLRRLAELGIKTVINLRGENQGTLADEAEARLLGLNYFNVPLPAWGRPEDASVRRVLEIIAAPESGLVFVHCKDGVDRTGMIVALYRISREGWKPVDALLEADRLGMRRVQYWMRDYVEDYGRRLSPDGTAQATARRQKGDGDFYDRIGNCVRVAEKKSFRTRKAGARVIQKTPGAIGRFLGGIF